MTNATKTKQKSLNLRDENVHHLNLYIYLKKFVLSDMVSINITGLSKNRYANFTTFINIFSVWVERWSRVGWGDYDVERGWTKLYQWNYTNHKKKRWDPTVSRNANNQPQKNCVVEVRERKGAGADKEEGRGKERKEKESHEEKLQTEYLQALMKTHRTIRWW